MNRSILLIYTGGTIGMKQDTESLALVPFNFNQILEEVPELKKFGYNIDTLSFDPPIDSSDVEPVFWVNLSGIIKRKYDKYDGFVILHGTDTMSYSASAMSFMLQNLEKPVVFTGSQLPIGMLRTDGKENLISAIEIAAAVDSDGHPIVPEVSLYFESELYRGNRTTKYNAENFRAFRSVNYPVLANVGIHIKFNKSVIHYPKTWGNTLNIKTEVDTNVVIIKIFPGLQQSVFKRMITTPGVRAVVLETFGSGNAPTKQWFLDIVKEAVDSGIVVINVTQCHAGSVDMDAYATGIALKRVGVVSGYDITTEAAITKLFFLMGQYISNKDVIREFTCDISGEISI